MRVLIVNAGSSTLKLRILDNDDAVVADALIEDPDPADALRGFLTDAPSVNAAGHRVVHGGPSLREAVRVDESVMARIEDVSKLAPLHNPPALAALRVLGSLRPELPSVACFDTAFHATLPESAAIYAIPSAWSERFGIRRYGFHGLSHAYASRRASELVGHPNTRVVSCHLGAGASLAAVVGGRSVDTTMGFTPLEGLVMATRSGTVDPGIVLWLQREAGMSADEVYDALEHRSGLLGLAGSSDMRDVMASTDPRSQRALGVYVHRLRAAIAAMAATMDGLDVLVFTGGVGENAAPVRTAVCAGLGFLGVSVEATTNDEAVPDAEITGDGRVRTFVIAAREDLEIARDVRRVLRG